MDNDLKLIPKAELHVHLEGSLSPAIARKLAQRNGIAFPEHLVAPDDSYISKDFLDFLKVFDELSAVIKTPEDYFDITYDYLARAAAQGAIYVEVMPSPDHAAMAGMSYTAMRDAVVEALGKAKTDHGIESSIYMSCVRHFGVEKCEHVAKEVVDNLHPLVRGFGMGGDEAGFPPAQFAKAYLIAREAGLGLTAHAGEHVGPEGIREAIETLHLSRVGHGVRAIEDDALIKDIIDREITLEVCPTSNVVLKVFPDYASHSLNRLRSVGVRTCLNSDDPPFFATSIGQEYQIARDHFAMTDSDLIEQTRNAIAASFADEETKARLFARCE